MFLVYLDDYACAIWQRWHEYGGPSWICQNRPSVFAHYGYLDLLVSPLCICQTQLSAFADKWYQLFFWSSVGFLPKKVLYFPSPIICIFIQVISTFVRVCCFLHCSSIGIHLSNPFSLSPSYSVMNGDGKKYLVMDGDLMDKGMEHRRISPKKKLYLPTPIIYPINYLIWGMDWG